MGRLVTGLTMVVGIVAGAWSATSAQTGTYAPPGSYLQSCRNISFANGILRAECNNAGHYSATTIDTRPCVPGSIYNGYGTLFCTAARPWGNDQALPPGSFAQSCSFIQVRGTRLKAFCRPKSGNSRWSELDLGQCRWGGTIGNVDGQLVCS